MATQECFALEIQKPKDHAVLDFLRQVQRLDQVKQELIDLFVFAQSPSDADGSLIEDLSHFNSELEELTRRMELCLEVHGVEEKEL